MKRGGEVRRNQECVSPVHNSRRYVSEENKKKVRVISLGGNRNAGRIVGSEWVKEASEGPGRVCWGRLGDNQSVK